MYIFQYFSWSFIEDILTAQCNQKNVHLVIPSQVGPLEGVNLLYSYYKKRGINVNILCSDNKKAKWLKDKRLPKVFATGPKLFSYGYNPKMLIWLRENIKKYDLIIIEGIWEYHNYAVWKVAKKSNVPYYVYLHGMLDPWFKKKYPFKHIKKYIYWKLLQYKILKNSNNLVLEEEVFIRRLDSLLHLIVGKKL